MKICHIVEAAGGGCGQVVIDLLKAGIAAGHEVTLIYSPVRAEAHFLAEIDSIRYALQIHELPMRRSVGPHDLMHMIKLAFALRRLGPFDVINSHSSKAGAIARIAGFFVSRAVHVYTPHAFVTMAQGATFFYQLAERALSHFCTAIICGTLCEKEHARQVLRIRESKLYIIYNGISLHYPANRVQARKTMGFSDTDYVIGFVGRLAPQKNPLRLVRVFENLTHVKRDVKMGVLGSGELKEEVHAALSHRDLHHRVHLLSGHNARDIMPGFDCLLCSSDYEGCGLVIIEALAAGVPVATTPVGVAVEPCMQGVAVSVAAGFSDNDLFQALMRVINQSQGNRAELFKNAIEIASRFGIDDAMEKANALYAQLVQRSHHRG